jgi:hypothetical protein
VSVEVRSGKRDAVSASESRVSRRCDGALADRLPLHAIRKAHEPSKVVTTGYSHGALAARYFAEFLNPNQAGIPTHISLGGPHWGDERSVGCLPLPACVHRLTGSSLLNTRNADDPTPGPAHNYEWDDPVMRQMMVLGPQGAVRSQMLRTPVVCRVK